jgi:phosphoribosylaminoimidazolecarboxamide formyltransferase/IMP cyclohydrolase
MAAASQLQITNLKMPTKTPHHATPGFSRLSSLLSPLSSLGGSMLPKKYALISVSDKTGLADFAAGLVARGYSILSTGTTFKTIAAAGIAAEEVSDITGFPECLDGRVKTLHPAIHGGILARRDNAAHMDFIGARGINSIDIVCVNLYPFKQTIQNPDASAEDIIENIDIGGPTMLRSAAKNYQDVYVLCDSEDYATLINNLKNGTDCLDFRRYLMYKVFSHTAVYDSLISNYLLQKTPSLPFAFPPQITFAYEKVSDMRYGENPNQKAAFYKECFNVDGSLASAMQLLGKELSFNNINDSNGALDLLREFAEPTAVAVKHANPCGVGIADNIYDAYIKAYDADPVSIFGGIVALNREVDLKLATKLSEIFLEVIIAPDYTKEAVDFLAEKKKNLRLLKLPTIMAGVKKGTLDAKKVLGGILIQDFDDILYNEQDITIPTKVKPTSEQMAALKFNFKVVKHTKSNAIVVGNGCSTLGIGMGQPNRITATEIALKHAGQKANGAVMASDAFFPFPDCVEAAAKAGIAAIIQPGGSLNDQKSIDRCDELGIAMVLCGNRHFKH